MRMDLIKTRSNTRQRCTEAFCGNEKNVLQCSILMYSIGNVNKYFIYNVQLILNRIVNIFAGE